MFLTSNGGILAPIAWLFGKLLDFIYNILANGDGIANLGLCIILFTIVVKIILLPLTFKQQKSAKINAVIQPEILKIQKKYKDRKDQESMLKMQEETQAVYDKYGTSMTNGCLTTFIQFPIIMALYDVIQNVPAYVGKIKEMYEPIAEQIVSVQGDSTKQFLIDFVDENSISAASAVMKQFSNLAEVGINNILDVLANFGVSHLNTLIDTIGGSELLVANVDKINEIHSFILGINISEAPGYKLSWALLIPISSALFNFISMKLTTGKQDNEAANNPMMKSMMITMPLMSIFICISLPAGIGIYWSMTALLSLITQLIVNFYYDHVDMDVLLEKQMAKAAKKLAKRGGKKTFMQRMMDTSASAQEELEKREAMRKNSASPLKNYVASEESKRAVEESKNKQYKEGSIGAKANIMMRYNQEKE